MQILLIDSHFLYRQGLKKYLEESSFFSVVGETNSGANALALACELNPDAVIMDINTLDQYGLEATRQLKDIYPHIKIVALSDSADHAFVNQALKAGVTSYVYKDAPCEEVVIALEALKRNHPYLSPEVLQPVINCYISSEPEESALKDYNRLSIREKEVLKLIVKGQGRSEIGKKLHISPKTVDRHKYSIRKKLNRRKEAEFQSFAGLIGLI